MCGLLGFQFKRPDRRVQLLSTALICLMEDRGNQSWGYWTPTTGIRKGTGPFTKAVTGRVFRGSDFMFGHTRQPTIGKVTPENAHPFSYKTIIGAHNGSVANYSDLNKEYNRDFQVDSQHIFAHIADGENLEEITGYGAIEWVDTAKPNRVHLCRWNGGSLSVARVMLKNGEIFGIVWASLEDELERSLGIAGFDTYRLLKIEENKHYFTEEDFDLHVAPDPMKFSGFRYASFTAPRGQGGSGTRGGGGKGKKNHKSTTSPSGGAGQDSGTFPFPFRDGHHRRLPASYTVPSGHCSLCYEPGYLTEFFDTGVKLCPTCFSEWAEDDAQREQLKLALPARTQTGPQRDVPRTDSKTVEWTDEHGVVQKAELMGGDFVN